MRLSSLSGLIARLAGVGGKFVVTFVLAREAGAAAVGEFALFFGAVNILVFLIGLDFHLFSIRELLLRQTAAGRLRVMGGQLAVDGSIYGVFIVLALLAGLTGVASLLPVPLGWLVAITIGDHLASQFSRAFMMLRRPHLANLIYAAKSGLWGWVGCAAIFAGFLPADLEPFYLLWLVFDVAAIVLGVAAMRLAMRGARLSRPGNMSGWFQRGFRTSRYFYATSVSTMLIAYLDRFVIAGNAGVAEAGVYAFWQSIAGLLPIVVYAVAGMHYLPILVESYKRRRMEEFHSAAAGFLKQTVALCLMTGALVLILSPWIAGMVGKPEIQFDRSLILLLLVGAMGNALWQVPYQILYSAGEDKFLAATLILITAVWGIADFVVIPFAGIHGAAAIVATANLIIYLWLQRTAAQHLESGARGLSAVRSPLLDRSVEA